QACLEAADMLGAHGLSASVADARFVKPLDEELIRELAESHEALITVEEGASGGFGAQVTHYLANAGLLDSGLKLRLLTLPDRAMPHGKIETLYAEAGLDAKGIVRQAFSLLGLDAAAAANSRA
ncbi:MAG: 1-deoxy-D-xylulose-5-phosphate synthase, partial [Hyphomicrobiales bacterium]